MSPKAARRVAWSPEKTRALLSDATIQAFAGVGIDLTKSLFSHQASAIEAILGGGERFNDDDRRRRHVIVSSGTASGKSVCYNVPTIETLLSDPSATALYMFPTKALAQDQLRALRNILSCVSRSEETVFDVGVFDGDTREDERVDVPILRDPDAFQPYNSKWSTAAKPSSGGPRRAKSLEEEYAGEAPEKFDYDKLRLGLQIVGGCVIAYGVGWYSTTLR